MLYYLYRYIIFHFSNSYTSAYVIINVPTISSIKIHLPLPFPQKNNFEFMPDL